MLGIQCIFRCTAWCRAWFLNYHHVKSSFVVFLTFHTFVFIFEDVFVLVQSFQMSWISSFLTPDPTDSCAFLSEVTAISRWYWGLDSLLANSCQHCSRVLLAVCTWALFCRKLVCGREMAMCVLLNNWTM